MAIIFCYKMYPCVKTSRKRMMERFDCRVLFAKDMQDKILLGEDTFEDARKLTRELVDIGVRGIGLTVAQYPYEIVRAHHQSGHIIATIEGEGEFFINGEWRPVSKDMVFVSPPERPGVFRAVPGKTWKFCWIHTLKSFFGPEARKRTSFLEADVMLFNLAVEGFLYSTQLEGNDKSAARWAEMVRYYGQRFISTSATSSRLEKLWNEVAEHPAKPWNIATLSKAAGMSKEHLRTCCRADTGRAPMKQVIHIRMQRAIELLQTTSDKQQVIAERVGYDNAFAFSNAFLKITGNRPSYYRKQG